MPGLQFNVTFDTSVENAPTGFVTAFDDAIQFYENIFSNPITINLDVDWGPSSDLGSSDFFTNTYSYKKIESALASDATSTTQELAVASLPATDPTNGGSIELSNAEAKALGLLSGNATGLDGTVSFGSEYAFDFDPTNRAIAGEWDFIGVAEHEISEVMGRVAILGANDDSVLDLFRYSAQGVRALAPSNGAFFSIDDGSTSINAFNGVGGGDLGDWAGATSDSYNAFSVDGVENAVTAGDITVMNALGYNLTNTNGVQEANGDFFGSRNSDILWENSSTGVVVIWQMNGSVIVGSPNVATIENGAWQPVAFADFNGDGFADVLWQNGTSGQVAIWEMNGSNIINSAIVGTISNPAWALNGVGNFDSSGDASILWQNTTTGQLAIWETNGTSLTGSGNIGSISNSAWKVAGVGNFAGNGVDDILWANSATGQLAIWEMSNNTVTGSAVIGDVANTAWQVAGVGDFAGTGADDILWENSATGQIAIWETNGISVAGSASIGAVSNTAWQVAGVGDYYGTGTDAILWQNNATGQVAVWQMSSGTVASSENITAVSSSWSIAHNPSLVG